MLQKSSKLWRLLVVVWLCAMVIMVSSCQRQSNSQQEIKVGVLEGLDSQVMEVAQQVAAEKYGLKIKIIQFSDYTMPNIALHDGSIDANVFQHQPYLDASIKARKLALTSIGKTYIYPMGVYSQKIKNIKNIPNGATIAIPNDPSNAARALLLLQKAGVLTLKPGVDVLATVQDIYKNPKNIIIKELDAAQIPRVLPDVTLAVINNNYAVQAGLYTDRDALFREGNDSRFAILIAVREADKNNPQLQKLVEVLHTPIVHEAALKIYQGEGVIPAWQN